MSLCWVSSGLLEWVIWKVLHSGLAFKHQTRPERPSRDKHSSLLGPFVGFGRKWSDEESLQDTKERGGKPEPDIFGTNHFHRRSQSSRGREIGQPRVQKGNVSTNRGPRLGHVTTRCPMGRHLASQMWGRRLQYKRMQAIAFALFAAKAETSPTPLPAAPACPHCTWRDTAF